MTTDLGGSRTHLTDWKILPVEGARPGTGPWNLIRVSDGKVIATYKTFRGATIRRRALMNDVSFNRARGLPM